MKKTFLFGAFLWTAFFAGCRGEEAEQAPALPAVPAVAMNDSIYSADSMTVALLHEKFWYYSNFKMKDSLPLVSEQGVKIAKPLLDYRIDTFLVEAYGDMLAGVGEGLVMKGFAYQGLEKMEEAYDLFVQYNVDGGKAARQNCHRIAWVYLDFGDYDKALAYVQKGLYHTTQAFKTWHYYFANSQGNLVDVYWESGDYERALFEARKTLDMTKERDPLYYNRVCPEIAELLLELNRPEEAEEYLREYFRTKPLKDPGNPYPTLNYLLSCYYQLSGWADLQQGEYELAAQNLEKALQYAANPPKPWEFRTGMVRSDIWLTKAGLFGAMGEEEKAVDAYHVAVQLARKYGSSNEKVIKVTGALAEYLIHRERYREAMETAHRTVALLIPNVDSTRYLDNPNPEQLAIQVQVIRFIELKARALHLLADQEGDTGMLLESFGVYQLAMEAIEKAQFQYRTPNAKRLARERTAALTEAAMQVAFELHEKTRKGEYLETAFGLVQRKKAGILLSRTQEVKARSFMDIPPELKEREDELQKEIAYYQRMVVQEEQKTASQQDSVALSKWENYQLDAQLALDSINRLLRDQNPKYQQLQQKLELASIEDIQKYLSRENAALLEYFMGDSTLVVFALNGKEVVFHRQTFGPELTEQLQAFHELVSCPQGQATEEEFKAFTTLGRSLYEQLLAPVKQILDQPNLIIVPDGRLGYLPFHLLLNHEVAESSDNYRTLPYLFREYSIRYEYSSSLLLQRWKRPRPEHTYAGFAPAYHGDELIAMRGAEDSLLMTRLFREELVREGLSPLENNRQEVEFAAQTMKGVKYEGADALESRFKEVSPRSRVLHLAMHALTNDAEPMYSQLIFSREPDTTEDGKLYAYELYNMNLDADLAVLSACETGAGKVQTGEGVMSLSHAFKYAGCPNIVMSLWKAHDRSTGKLAKDFFENLRSGKGKADALNRARLDFLTGADERYTHPFYWGGMVLVGDNDPVKTGRGWWYLVVLGLVAGGIVILMVCKLDKNE